MHILKPCSKSFPQEAEKKMKEKLDEEEKKTAEAKIDVAEEEADEDEKADSDNTDESFEVQNFSLNETFVQRILLVSGMEVCKLFDFVLQSPQVS